MIESDSHVDVGVVFVGIAVRFDVRLKNRWIPAINHHLADAYRNLRVPDSFLKAFAVLLRIAKPHFIGSVHDDLGSVRRLQSKCANISGLTFGQCRRGVGIFPTVMVPIIHVFTEDDQLRVRNGLYRVQLYEEGICGRTSGTAFRSEQLNENGMRTFARCVSSRGLVLDLQASPVGWRSLRE